MPPETRKHTFDNIWIFQALDLHHYEDNIMTRVPFKDKEQDDQESFKQKTSQNKKEENISSKEAPNPFS